MKIHLLMTCYITDSRIQPAGYYQIEETDKFSQVLSTLQSLRAIKFSSSEIRITLDQGYSENREKLKALAKQWHPDAQYFENRLEDFQGWKLAIDRIPADTDWVLLMANHDHVFVQQDSRQFFSYLERVQGENVSSIAHVSHWTEALGWRAIKRDQNRKDGLELWFRSTETIGTVAVRLDEIQSWFLDDFTKGSRLVRPDNPFGPSVKVSNRNHSLPMVEFFRHLDGYGHVGLTADHASALRSNVVYRNGEIEERAYQFGNLDQDGTELLRTPKFYEAGHADKLDEIRNLLYLTTAYRVRLKVLGALMGNTNASLNVKARACLSTLISAEFWSSMWAPIASVMAKRSKS
jgi:hypothetical protein